MRNLINFLLKYNYWFLFVILEVASFVLLFRFNNYQQSAYFTSANTVVGAVYEVSGGISSYFHLKSVNEDLLDRNMLLEEQINNLEKALKEQGFLNMNACIAYAPKEDEYLTNNSVEFHAHLGYRMVGQFYQCGYKFGRWYDMVWMEKLIGEHGANPKRPF